MGSVGMPDSRHTPRPGTLDWCSSMPSSLSSSMRTIRHIFASPCAASAIVTLVAPAAFVRLSDHAADLAVTASVCGFAAIESLTRLVQVLRIARQSHSSDDSEEQYLNDTLVSFIPSAAATAGGLVSLAYDAPSRYPQCLTYTAAQVIGGMIAHHLIRSYQSPTKRHSVDSSEQSTLGTAMSGQAITACTSRPLSARQHDHTDAV